jgi:Na+-transporting methylmalonyl-CoA/oxaloacetate decarboxylase gamma subunit
MDNTLMQAVVALLVGALLILAGVAVVYILRTIQASATPAVSAIMDALLPWAMKAVYAGEWTAAQALDDIDRELDGVDKAAVANSLYDLLPPVIVIAGKTISIDLVKHLITRDMWADLVKRVFEETDALVERNRDYLKKQIPPTLAAYTGGSLVAANTTFSIKATEAPGG